ncbi:olfactory receptor 1-like [Triplophysa rosa]|uniref:olfactory receptor 1-like n=1 Tax=Triplophysa rosa TaxID=992332 RepID=UPI002545F30E|nr:olfactory receptor 1-like [Triplophysa rosa]
MSSMLSNTSVNSSFVRPVTFFINGFSNIPHAKYYYVFLSLVYAVTVFGNSFIMYIIYLARRLHTAKYVAVFHLALSDLCGSSALIPRLINMFLFNHQDVLYEACLANMFFIYHFMNMQSLTLLALSFDRLIAICFPLRYHVIVTKSVMFLIIAAIWIFSVTIFAILVGLLTRLSFCRSTVVNSYFCDHGPIYSLACNDNSINIFMVIICFGLLICLPLLLIIFSYFCIALALSKIAHGGDRIKAMKTCTSHLLLVAIFYLPVLSVNISALTASLHPNTRIINNSLSQIIPPMLNPIIYTLKTDEVMQSIKDMYKRNKLRNINIYKITLR